MWNSAGCIQVSTLRLSTPARAPEAPARAAPQADCELSCQLTLAHGNRHRISIIALGRLECRATHGAGSSCLQALPPALNTSAPVQALASSVAARSTYGQVSLQGDAVLAGVLGGRLELPAEVPLQPVGEADGGVLRLARGAQAVQHLRAGRAL